VDYPTRLADLVTEDRPGDAVELFMTEAVGMPAEFVTQMRGAPFWTQMEATATGLVYDSQLIGDFRVPTTRLATITTPTLLLDGGTTPWMTRTADAVAAAIPTARRRTLAGQPHNVADDVMAPVVVEDILASAH
jgi:hypothetical protein